MQRLIYANEEIRVQLQLFKDINEAYIYYIKDSFKRKSSVKEEMRST